jgi:hypothetical protein
MDNSLDSDCEDIRDGNCNGIMDGPLEDIFEGSEIVKASVTAPWSAPWTATVMVDSLDGDCEDILDGDCNGIMDGPLEDIFNGLAIVKASETARWSSPWMATAMASWTATAT